MIFTEGINLNKEIHYLGSSLRYFAEGERHVDRFFEHEALLMVFSGRFASPKTESLMRSGAVNTIFSADIHTNRVTAKAFLPNICMCILMRNGLKTSG